MASSAAPKVARKKCIVMPRTGAVPMHRSVKDVLGSASHAVLGDVKMDPW